MRRGGFCFHSKDHALTWMRMSIGFFQAIWYSEQSIMEIISICNYFGNMLVHYGVIRSKRVFSSRAKKFGDWRVQFVGKNWNEVVSGKNIAGEWMGVRKKKYMLAVKAQNRQGGEICLRGANRERRNEDTLHWETEHIRPETTIVYSAWNWSENETRQEKPKLRRTKNGITRLSS